MWRTILIAGLIGGVIAGGACSLIATAFAGQVPSQWGMAVGYTTMLVALSAIFVAVKRHRDVALGGMIRFWPAFGMGLAISLIASVIYAFAWEGALAAMGGTDAFIDGYIAQLRREGGDPARLASMMAQMDAMRASYANPLFRLPVTMTEIAPVGILVSLASAALLRNPRFLPARAAAS
jgi:FtsH-binding integral membrane protein